LTLCENFLFLLLCQSIYLLVIKVLEVLLLNLSKLLIFLEQEVVGGGHVVVFVSINALDSIVLLEVVVDKEFEDLNVDRDLRETNEDAAGDLLECNLVEPGVLADI